MSPPIELSFSIFQWWERKDLVLFLTSKLYPDSHDFSALFSLDELDKIKTWHDTKQLFLTMERYLQVSNANRMPVVYKKKSRRP